MISSNPQPDLQETAMPGERVSGPPLLLDADEDPGAPWLRMLGTTALLIGVGLWVASALGLDPTNVPQRKDFENFHFPSLRLFAQLPFLEAISDYPAAPFPLFYALSGWLYGLTGSLLALRVWGVFLGLALLGCVAALARRRFHHSPTMATSMVAVALISPYFRGQTVYVNTDILALLFAAGALLAFGEQAPRVPSLRALLALSVACLAVYTRQFYAFVPAYLLFRIWVERPPRESALAAGLCGLLAVPVVVLVVHWGGPTPPGFAQHATASFANSIPVVVLLLSFYLAPLALVTVCMHRTALAEDLRSWKLWAMIAPFLLLGAVVLVRAEDVPEVVGGGLPLHLISSLPVPGSIRKGLFALAVIVGGGYLAYTVHQNIRRNAILALIALAFFPTGILYQRYFDPLIALVVVGALSVRELSGRGLQILASTMIALELFVSLTGALHYRSVFSTDETRSSAEQPPK